MNKKATVAQLVERRLPKPQVAGSTPVCRSSPHFHLVANLLIENFNIRRQR